MLTMYLASGKKKHDRSFWVNAADGMISWDKKKSPKANKTLQLEKVDSEPTVRTAQEWFDAIDTDRSGELDQDELAELYLQARGEKLKGKLLKSAMRTMDIDGDGSISFDEFERWWRAHGGDLELFRPLAITVHAGDLQLLLVAKDAETKRRWVNGLNAVLRKLGKGPVNRHSF